MKEFCLAQDEETCKKIIYESGVYVGTFIKFMLKLNNLCSELIECEVIDVDFKFKLSKVPSLLLKFVVTNQSLYV